MTASIAAEYANAGDFDVRFSHAVTGLTQTADGVDVETSAPGGTNESRAGYVIGCDGGRSTVRKRADIEFEGFTYPERFIKIATISTSASQSQRRPPQLFFRPLPVVQPVQGAGQAPARPVAGHLSAPGRRDRRGRAAPRAGRDPPAEIFSKPRALRDPIRQRLWRASVRGGDLPPGPRAARRRSAHLNNPIGDWGPAAASMTASTSRTSSPA